MNKPLCKNILWGCLLAVTMPAHADDFVPVEPSPLTSDVNGFIVNLSWEWGNAAIPGNLTDFETGQMPDDWEIKTGYTYDPMGNWLVYDFSEIEDLQLTHSGNYGALIMMAPDGDTPESFHQDEWMIMKPQKGAVYMDFWYYIHPELLEVGGYQDFPDHYYVKISRDNGATWNELWDARWDMGDVDGVQQASLFLGNPTDESTLVAFQAVSAPDESLYFLWAVDDIEFFTADAAANRALKGTATTVTPPRRNITQLNTHRKFTPGADATKAPRKSPSEWLNNGNITFRVYLDGYLVGDYIKARHFSDYSAKDGGEHTYMVMAWSEALDQEYDAASITVDVEATEFAPVRNVKAMYEPQSDGKYTITASWDAPEGDMRPSHYNVYMNGKSIGWVEPDNELSLGQSGLFKGAYTLGVEAVYQRPDGTSEALTASVYPGTVPMPLNLTSSIGDDNAVSLTWEEPQPCGKNLSGYNVWRDDKLVCTNLAATEYIDPQSDNLMHRYSVHALYDDGETSLPAELIVRDYALPDIEPPYEASFTSGHLPQGWKVELVDPYMNVKDMYAWRLDNWFGLQMPEDGLDGGFASVSAEVSGMARIESYLVSPVFELGENDEVSFSKYYHEEKPGPSGSASFNLQIMDTEIGEWTDLADLAASDNGRATYSLKDYAGLCVRLRWGFLGRNSGVAAINDVALRAAGTGSVQIVAADEDSTFDVYRIDGTTVTLGASRALIENLPAGIYILRHEGNAFKIRR